MAAYNFNPDYLPKYPDVVEGEHVLFSRTEPTEQLHDGTVLGIEDFILGARTAGLRQHMGTYALKMAVYSLGKGEEPFRSVWNLRYQAGGAHGDFLIPNVFLHYFYVHTQSLYDEYEENKPLKPNKRRYTPVTWRVIEAVLLDENPED